MDQLPNHPDPAEREQAGVLSRKEIKKKIKKTLSMGLATGFAFHDKRTSSA